MKVDRLYRYPVKGLSPAPLSHVAVQADAVFPGDRHYALSGGVATPTQTGWQNKTNFLNLARHEKLAALETEYDEDTTTLTIKRMGKQVCRGKLNDPLGRAMIEDFFAAFMARAVPARPRIVEATPASALTDVEPPYVSLINMASVRDLERIMGVPIDPLRFRGNIYFESDKPWCELDWVGQRIAIGLVRCEVKEVTGRCAATSVDPKTGLRDHNVPKALQKGYGHMNMGVYLRMENSGEIAVGDALTH